MSDATLPPFLAILLERLEEQEAMDLEFKAARGVLPKDIWPTVSAFANTRGGWLLLGIDESGRTPQVEGVRNPHQILQTLHDAFRNPEKISHPVCGPDDATVEHLGDKQVIAIRVRAASRNLRPVFINGNPYTGTYVRRHTGDYRCSRVEVNRMIREASDVASDSTVLAGYSLNDLDIDTLAGYRRRFQTWNPANPWNNYDHEHFLRVLGAYGRDRESNTEGLTVAGLLMFGGVPALRDWRKRHLIDYRLQLSDPDSDTRWDDRVAWNGNLLGAFDAIYPRLTADLPVPFRLQGATRIDEGPGHVAMREALINLLVHADYAERDVSLIIRSGDGCYFSNPGNSRIPELDLLSGRHRSDPRNPVLLLMFRMIGLADEAGTGIPKIMAGWRQLGYQPPSVEVDTDRYEFVLCLRYAHLLSDDDRAWLRALGDNWSEPERLALVYARHEGDVDNFRLRQLTGQHPADVTKVLGGLRDRGLLEMTGGKRGARYQLGPAAMSGVSGPKPPELLPKPPELLPKPPELLPKPPELLPKPPESAPDPRELWSDLEAIAGQVRGQRYTAATARDRVVVELCAHTPLSLRDLALLLGRSQEYVRKVVGPLLTSGRLMYLYPDQPNHPRQKYVAGPKAQDFIEGAPLSS